MKLYHRLLSSAVAAAVVGAVALSASPAQAASTTIYASPNGSGSSCTVTSPCSLDGAKTAARSAKAGAAQVTVELSNGRYRIQSPLTFGPDDGGGASSQITWKAADGATPVITGADSVQGWSVYDSTKNIWSAPIPVGVDTRTLVVNGQMAPRASLPISRSDVDFTATGVTLKSAALQALAGQPQQNRIELRGQNYFTDRYSPVSRISGTTAEMVQPAWKNNIWGWDTITGPGFGHQTLSLENSLSFISDPGEWYVDPSAGRLYYKPADGVNPSSLSVELPRLQSLLSISGTYDQPVQNLSFQGIQFSGTSWLAPSSSDGYASQQAGSYLAGDRSYYPSDALQSCNGFGCAAFERTRSSWSQQPGAVQVSAAKNIAFTGNRFVGLGQVGLGIGNDANAHTSGVGLGAQNITVRGNLFTELAGGGIVVGGNQADAHHPSRPEMTNSNVVIDANTVVRTSIAYNDNAGILSTYVDSAQITRNEVAQLPYDGIDIGYGWGINDPGGSVDYDQRGYYQFNPKYDTPTTFRNNVVANNVVHDIKQVLGDGGSIYTLSSSPDTVIRDNFMYNIRNTIGLYLDEGSRYIKLNNNVVRDAGNWLYANTASNRIVNDNTADGNWHMGGSVGGDWSTRYNNSIVSDNAVSGSIWPTGAQAVICASGVPAQFRYTITTDPCTSTPLRDGWKTTSSVTKSSFGQAAPVFSLGAAGSDIWGFGGQRDDQYGAIYRDDSFGANSTITARVDKIADSNEWAKTGVFVRNDATKAASSSGYAAVVLTPRHGVSFAWDADGDGLLDRSSDAPAAADKPVYVRLTRTADKVSGYFSTDGLAWTQLGAAVAVPGVAATQDAGIITTSHDSSTFAINTVSAVQLTTGVAAPWKWTAASETRISQTGTDSFSLAAAGADIWGLNRPADDEYGAVYQEDALGSGGSVTTKVQQKDGHEWAKAGVAVRNDFSKNRSSTGYAVLAVTPRHGVVLEWDSDADGFLDKETAANIDAARPLWLRLTRTDSSVTGSYSTDGATWTTVGTAALSSADQKLDAGVLSSSHDRSALADNLFSNVAVVNPVVNLAVTTSSRCVAGKVGLVVQVENKEAAAVDVVIDTAYGSKTLTAIGSGKTVSNVFSTRLSSMPAGTVKTTANISGKKDTVQKDSPFDAKTCAP